MAEPPIAGTVAPGWEAVREVFAGNFSATDSDPGDLGAGLCVIAGGRTVVDLVGGWRDRAATQPFTARTLVNSYSVGKGVTAAVALAAISRGLVDLDAPANRYWPALRADTSLRELLSHQGGLPAVRDDVDDSVPMNWPAMCAALAATEPWWEPGTAHGYHTNTFGFVVGEPLRRAAGAARFRDLLQAWFAGPLGADLMYAVPEADLIRCAEIDTPFGTATLPAKTADDFPDPMAQMRHHAYFHPSTLSGMGVIETSAWRQAEVPSTNLHATASGVAAVYRSLLDPDGPVDRGLLREATTTQVDGTDLVLEQRSRFGLGFQLHQDERPVGVTEASFGHYGYGGSIGFADVEADMAVGYVINRPGDRWQIPRTRRLLAVLRETIAGAPR